MKTLVILSGGMDSLTALAIAVSVRKKGLVSCINFQYGSKHNAKENEAVKKIVEHYGVPLIQIPLAFNDYLKSNLLTSGGEVPDGHYAEENMKKTVIPFRNGIMLSIAAGVAESIGARNIILGNHAGDHAVYPDCRKLFTRYMADAIEVGTWGGVHLDTPFVEMTKDELLGIGLNYATPYHLSWSCYKGGEKHCGRCGTCVERLEAFELAGAIDPVEYEDREYYKAVIKAGPQAQT